MDRVSYAQCDTCGKRRYFSRADAKKVANTRHSDHISLYRCPVADGWHLGHLPRDINRGNSDRRSYEAGALRRLQQRRAAAS